MKRKLFYAAGFIIIALSITSCEKSCKVCQQNTYNTSTGALVTNGSEAEYCGTELIAIESTKDVTLGGTTTKWECR
jgi:hypothetical protein